MQSGNLRRAKEIIGRYPEVFESLLQFERTKKLPKLYRRKRINLTIDENILRDFISYCRQNSINMSRCIEARMIEILKKGRC